MAIELIEAGFEEPTVYRVAAEDKMNCRDDAERLLQRMFSALAVEYRIPVDKARQTLARQLAREVVPGMKDPGWPRRSWTGSFRMRNERREHLRDLLDY